MRIYTTTVTNYIIDDISYDSMLHLLDMLIDLKVVSHYEEIKRYDPEERIVILKDDIEVGNYSYGEARLDEEIYDAIPEFLKNTKIEEIEQ